ARPKLMRASDLTIDIHVRLESTAEQPSLFKKKLTSSLRALRIDQTSRTFVKITFIVPPGYAPPYLQNPRKLDIFLFSVEEQHDSDQSDMFGETSDDEDEGYLYFF
ncbi:hypothetical protein IL306_008028, partial [Fusarium sp. DS 682]